MSQNRGVSDVRVAKDKLIVILETLEYFKEQISPAEQMDLSRLVQLCFKELSVSMSILEKAFVDSIDGNKLHYILERLVIKLNNTLMEVKKKSIDLISFGVEEIKGEVHNFFEDIGANNGTGSP